MVLKNNKRVVVIRSPYSSVQTGTVATIEKVRIDWFGPGQHLYELRDLPHRLFRKHEIRCQN